MTIEEIKRAMENFQFELQYNEYRYANSEIQAMQTALKALEKELERLENKPLSLETLREMIGEPVYVVFSPWEKYNIEAEGEWTVIVGVNDKWCRAINRTFPLKSCQYYKYKPQEVQDENY